jgi:uncharacterized protein YcsI (UPF0317 family)
MNAFIGETGAAIRAAARSEKLTHDTSGRAMGFVQANIIIIPAEYADSFHTFCQLNAQSCPIIGRSEPGNSAIPVLGSDIDIRSDLPRYRIYRDGMFDSEVTNLSSLWRPDLVTFAIGCSFTFEHAILAEGIPLRHITLRRNVAMYRTSIQTVAHGPFGGPLVVSMRPFSAAADAERASTISARFTRMHGGPIHVGKPAALGIGNLQQPDYGDPVPVNPDDVLLFWACGVTSQVALQSARLPFFYSHAPGCMLVTDLPNAAFDESSA